MGFWGRDDGDADERLLVGTHLVVLHDRGVGDLLHVRDRLRHDHRRPGFAKLRNGGGIVMVSVNVGNQDEIGRFCLGEVRHLVPGRR